MKPMLQRFDVEALVAFTDSNNTQLLEVEIVDSTLELQTEVLLAAVVFRLDEGMVVARYFPQDGLKFAKTDLQNVGSYFVDMLGENEFIQLRPSQTLGKINKVIVWSARPPLDDDTGFGLCGSDQSIAWEVGPDGLLLEKSFDEMQSFYNLNKTLQNGSILVSFTIGRLV
jgi:hypothetical protein